MPQTHRPRYIIASTTAKYNEPENVFSVPADLVFPCSSTNEIDGDTATMLADLGCKGVFEGSHMPSTNEAIKVYKKRGLMHGGYITTLAVDSLFNGLELSRRPFVEGDDLDARIKKAVDSIYDEARATAKEFNLRGTVRNVWWGAAVNQSRFSARGGGEEGGWRAPERRGLEDGPTSHLVLTLLPFSSACNTSARWRGHPFWSHHPGVPARCRRDGRTRGHLIEAQG